MLAHVCPPSHWPACSVRLAIVTLSLGHYLTFFFNGRTFFFLPLKWKLCIAPVNGKQASFATNRRYY